MWSRALSGSSTPSPTSASPTPNWPNWSRRLVDSATLDWLADYRFTGDIDGYPEGELYFPGSPVLTVRGTFAESVLLETLVLSILNYDSAVASAAARMSAAANGRPIIEMGRRRAHEYAAVAAARAAYLAGFATTSNLEAGRRYGIPTRGTVAHAFILLHDTEEAAFRAQMRIWAPTPPCWWTPTTSPAVSTAVRVAGPELGAIRIDSGDLGVLARQAREQLDALGAKDTRIVVSGDLDEHAIAALRAEPVDAYGVGTSVVTGSGAPDRGHGLQTGRGERQARGQTQRAQGLPRGPQGRAASPQTDRDGTGGDRLPGQQPT